ncbi:hypothetical protein [Nitrosomonas aestuarii]|uniref:hypothetical protein n=1 Tax=Nitrosomonas aestuarii TaxID=52441 RepID=UPI000D325E2B|nr:hypothetical protein [Nitrosomonas aestuarii]PTN12494.1 hypothetical protein C8R11_10362 [Nitrosomonas aestuarii]
MATTKPKSKIKKQNFAASLIESGNKKIGRRAPSSTPPEFSQRLIHHPDGEAAAALIKEQAAFEADLKFGAELAQVKLDTENIDTRFKAAHKLLGDLEIKKANTARYIKSGALHSTGKKDASDIQWKDWRRKDQILLCVLLSFLVIAAGLGMGNVYANLVASGNAVFIEKPWLALMISALMPIASVSVKFVTNFMTYDSSRKTYAKCIYAATGIAFLFWGSMFGVIHTGVAGSIDWDSFGESADPGFAFIWSQLLVEMLAASALFLAVEDIYMRYSPDVYVENLEFIEIEKALKEHHATHEVLREKRGQLHGRRVELEAEREAFINERIVEYISLRARHIATMNSHAGR